ncbi:MAG: efflux RND transporter periplasmic adaptor subunit [bacterium]|nr:efflux RND transporter periplasmic adaptor subunit [bacterium]
MQKIILTIKKHKIVSLLLIAALSGGFYYWRSLSAADSAAPRYLTAAAAKGTLINSVSGSGQVSASSRVDLKAKVSGDIINVSIKAGQQVKSGGVIARLDAANAYKAVRDAQASLESARLSYDKFIRPADADSVMQAENAVASAQANLDKLKLSQPVDFLNAENNLQSAKNNLDKTYSDAFTAVSNAFLNLPNIISSLNDILNSDKISQTEISLNKGTFNTAALYNSSYDSDRPKIKSFENVAAGDYAAARTSFDANYANFKNAGVYSEPAAIERLLDETLAAAKDMAQAVKSQSNYLNAWSDARRLRNTSVFSQVAVYLSDLNTYAGQINNSVSGLMSLRATKQNNEQAIVSAENSLRALKENQPRDLAAAEAGLKERQASAKSLLAGADPLDLRSQELTLEQRRNSLADAQRALADYTVRAPFDGLIAEVNVKPGDSAAGAVIATLITKQQIAEISLNEIDAAKVNAGDKVNLTFDAIDGLTITGQVAEVDALGAVAQGVVTYNVKIIFDTQDERVKSGMSVNAAIITNVKTDVLTVPNSAVKTDANGANFVQTLDADGQPQNVPVQIGLVNDTDAEIISGINEGEKIITQTITTGAAGTAAQTGAAGGLRIPGITGGSAGGGGNRSGGGTFITR